MTARKVLLRIAVLILPVFLSIASCAPIDAPDARSAKVPSPTPPFEKYKGLNEKRDPITRVKLGRDVLVPQPLRQDVMPDVVVGPYELRGETLASALQLILDDYDVSLAFESNQGLTRRITVANLHGKLRDVVNRVCSLADLYCHYEADTLTIKDTETFIVDLPPLGGGATGTASGGSTGSSTGSTTGSTSTTSSSSGSSGGSGGASQAYAQIAAGLRAGIGTTPTIDEATRVMIYTATQRSNKYAMQYFERLRKNTALIVFETNIWEVTLNAENRTGIDWSGIFNSMGGFEIETLLPGTIPAGTGTPISIKPTYSNGGSITADLVLEFISSRGAVKTISQPQITVLSGSRASFVVTQNQNYVAQLTRTPAVPPAVTDTVSTTTATVTTGLTMNVGSSWDQSTVYGDLNIVLDDLLRLETFPTSGGNIQLPQTTSRALQTAIRVRPGDAILIGGLVSEKDNTDAQGPGFMQPLFATSRSVKKVNSELVFLMRPRVVTFDMGSDSDTPLVVEAPREGIAHKITAVPDITDSINSIFGTSDPATPQPALPPAPEAAEVKAVVPVPVAKVETKPAAAKDKAKTNTNAPISLSGAKANGGVNQ